MVCALTAALFFIWVLPLGVFIGPSQEKTACNGQRAMCLCSHIQAKAKSGPVQSVGLKANSDSNKESSASGGAAGHYYLAAHLFVQNNLNQSAVTDPAFLAYCNPSIRSVEHIPKA